MIGKWKLLDRWEIFKNRFVTLRVDRCELPDGRIMPNYYTLDFMDWIQVVALTSDNKMVMIRQYRHGVKEVLLEIPGGAIDRGEEPESPLAAAQRELREETGYVSENWQAIGCHCPNPALQNNKMHLFLALDCKWQGEPQFDPFEDIEIKLMEASEVYQKVDNGELTHTLVLGGLLLARKYLLDEN